MDSAGVFIIGASAAVYGLATAGLVLMPQRHVVVGVTALPQWVILPLLLLGFALCDVALSSNVAVYAHLGGSIAGITLGAVFRRLPVPDAFTDADQRAKMRLQEEEG